MTTAAQRTPIFDVGAVRRQFPALAQKVKAGDADATARYMTFLGSGGSKYPVDLLREAGVDMTTDEPLELTIREMSRVMDEMEAILANRGAGSAGAPP